MGVNSLGGYSPGGKWHGVKSTGVNVRGVIGGG